MSVCSQCDLSPRCLISQCTAGFYVAAGHSQVKKWMFPGALWGLDFLVQGDCRSDFLSISIQGKQNVICAISKTAS